MDEMLAPLQEPEPIHIDLSTETSTKPASASTEPAVVNTSPTSTFKVGRPSGGHSKHADSAFHPSGRSKAPSPTTPKRRTRLSTGSLPLPTRTHTTFINLDSDSDDEDIKLLSIEKPVVPRRSKLTQIRPAQQGRVIAPRPRPTIIAPPAPIVVNIDDEGTGVRKTPTSSRNIRNVKSTKIPDIELLMECTDEPLSPAQVAKFKQLDEIYSASQAQINAAKNRKFVRVEIVSPGVEKVIIMEKYQVPVNPVQNNQMNHLQQQLQNTINVSQLPRVTTNLPVRDIQQNLQNGAMVLQFENGLPKLVPASQSTSVSRQVSLAPTTPILKNQITPPSVTSVTNVTKSTMMSRMPRISLKDPSTSMESFIPPGIDQLECTPVVGTSGYGIKHPKSMDVKLAKPTPAHTTPSVDWVPLSEFYYGKLEGDPTYSESKQTPLGNEFRFKCYQCHKMLYNNLETMLHIQSHLDTERQQKIDLTDLTQCKHCYMQFDTPFEKQQHVEKVHQADSRALVCRICERDMKDTHTLSAHMKNFHRRSEMPYVCQLCQFRSSFYADVVDHFKKRHEGSQHFLCFYCLKVMRAPMASQASHYCQTHHFYQHLQKHLTSRNLGKKCGSCKLIFVTKIDGDVHKNSDHTSQNKAIGSTSALRTDSQVMISVSNKDKVKSLNAPVTKKAQEFRQLHLDERESMFSCLECQKHLGDMAQHLKKYLLCSLCRFATNCSNSYMKHMQSYHQGKTGADGTSERPMDDRLYCACGYKSRYGNKLARHLVLCSKRTCYRIPYSDFLQTEPGKPTPPIFNMLGLMKRHGKKTQNSRQMARSIIHDVVNDVFPAETAAIDAVNRVLSETIQHIAPDDKPQDPDSEYIPPELKGSKKWKTVKILDNSTPSTASVFLGSVDSNQDDSSRGGRSTPSSITSATAPSPVPSGTSDIQRDNDEQLGEDNQSSERMDDETAKEENDENSKLSNDKMEDLEAEDVDIESMSDNEKSPENDTETKEKMDENADSNLQSANMEVESEILEKTLSDAEEAANEDVDMDESKLLGEVNDEDKDDLDEEAEAKLLEDETDEKGEQEKVELSGQEEKEKEEDVSSLKSSNSNYSRGTPTVDEHDDDQTKEEEEEMEDAEGEKDNLEGVKNDVNGKKEDDEEDNEDAEGEKEDAEVEEDAECEKEDAKVGDEDAEGEKEDAEVDSNVNAEGKKEDDEVDDEDAEAEKEDAESEKEDAKVGDEDAECEKEDAEVESNVNAEGKKEDDKVDDEDAEAEKEDAEVNNEDAEEDKDVAQCVAKDVEGKKEDTKGDKKDDSNKLEAGSEEEKADESEKEDEEEEGEVSDEKESTAPVIDDISTKTETGDSTHKIIGIEANADIVAETRVSEKMEFENQPDERSEAKTLIQEETEAEVQDNADEEAVVDTEKDSGDSSQEVDASQRDNNETTPTRPGGSSQDSNKTPLSQESNRSSSSSGDRSYQRRDDGHHGNQQRDDGYHSNQQRDDGDRRDYRDRNYRDDRHHDDRRRDYHDNRGYHRDDRSSGYQGDRYDRRHDDRNNRDDNRDRSYDRDRGRQDDRFYRDDRRDRGRYQGDHNRRRDDRYGNDRRDYR